MASWVDSSAEYMALPVNIKRGNAIPLDTTSVWSSEEAMRSYAQTGGTSYVGQILTLADGTSTKAFIILDEAGNLQEFGNDSALSGNAKNADDVLAGRIGVLSSKIDSISALTGSTGALSGFAAETDARLHEEITSLSGNAKTSDDSLSSQIATLSGNVSSTDSTLSSQISSLSGDAKSADDALASTIGTLTSQIQTLSGYITSMQSMLSAYLTSFFEYPEPT